MNRLAQEKSPYLLQHSHNPVDWYPWGDEAFALARRQDKPILLSIGYSTCHWCHVMERECFENPAIADLMNRRLVCIKVDREERPDVDHLYMGAVQALTGQGGWPLHVFLTPDLKPFFGGTYFPPEDRWGRPGWPRLVEALGQAWENLDQRKILLERATSLTEALAQRPKGTENHSVREIGATTFLSLKQAFHADGGFSVSPKFPTPVNQQFLFRWAHAMDQAGDPATALESREMALKTLRAMAQGGIRDQLGGGFHRYSTDSRWHLPHFEKMLYDNAQLVLNYLDAGQATGDPFFFGVARATLDYLLRDLHHPGGGFFSAEDADSAVTPGGPMAEGAFYVWSAEEIRSLLGDRAPLFFRRYGVEEFGNVAEDPHGEFKGKNVLFLQGTDDGSELYREMNEVLRKAREQRPRPFRDDKILTGWNGLALSALARSSALLGDVSYLNAAKNGAQFLRDNLWDGENRELYRRWREGDRAIPAQADDYAFLIQGLLDLYEAGFDPAPLLWAEDLADLLGQKFMDTDGRLFLVREAGPLPFRVFEGMDNVEPAPSSVAVSAFFRLAILRDRPDLADRARQMIVSRLRGALDHPLGHTGLLASAVFDEGPPSLLVIAGRPEDQATKDFLKEARESYFGVLALADQGAGQDVLVGRLPFLKFMKTPPGRAKAFLCRDGVCRSAVESIEELQQTLNLKTEVELPKKSPLPPLSS